MFDLVILLSLIITHVLSASEPSEYILDFPTWNNPLNITVARPYSKNYIMMIGDWGAASSESTYVKVQRQVAAKMNAYYNAQKAKGMNLLFVAAVGDNFYWTGQDCNTWAAEWTQMYGTDLTSVPWLAIKGNHDWYAILNQEANSLEAMTFPMHFPPEYMFPMSWISGIVHPDDCHLTPFDSI